MSTLLQLALAGIAALLLLWGIAAFNGLVRRRNEIANAFAQIDVQFKRRHDLVPNPSRRPGATWQHEQDTLQAVAAARVGAHCAADSARRGPSDAAAIAALGTAEGALGGTLARLMAVVEAYPELKADATMRELSEELSHREPDRLRAQAFNDAVLDYNNAVQQAPANFVASLFWDSGRGDARSHSHRRRARSGPRPLLAAPEMLFRRHQRLPRRRRPACSLASRRRAAGARRRRQRRPGLLWRIAVPIADGYPALFFQTNTAVVVLFVVGGCWIETMRLREGGGAARLAGARLSLASPDAGAPARQRDPRIALAARVRPPDARVLPRDASINAFAAGWTADDAVIAVTRARSSA